MGDNLFNRYTTIFAIAFLIGACEPSLEKQEADAWHYANIGRAEQSYRDFIATWPNSEHVPAARRRIEALAWRNAAWTNTDEAYEEFLSSWPNSIFTPLADDLLGWLHTRDLPFKIDRQVEIDLNLLIPLRTNAKELDHKQGLTDSTKFLLECSGYSVNSPGTILNGVARLEVLIAGTGIPNRYDFPNRDPVTINGGTDLKGSFRWTPSSGPTLRREFAYVDEPPGVAFLVGDRIDATKDGMQARSIGRALAAKDSYWDQLVYLVLESAGPRAFLCPVTASPNTSSWSRATRKTSMPTIGAAVAALFSDQFGRTEAAASIIAYSDTPFAEQYIDRYLKDFARYPDQRALAQSLVDEIRGSSGSD